MDSTCEFVALWTQLWIMSSECWRLTLTLDIVVGVRAPLISRSRVRACYWLFVLMFSGATVLALKILGNTVQLYICVRARTQK